MKPKHTYSSIARDLGKDKRTIQLWQQKAKEEGVELGQLVSGQREFTDEERDRLLTYGKAEASAFIETTEIAAVEQVELALPDAFNPLAAIGKFDGAVGQATDPDQIVLYAQAMLGAAESAIDAKTEQQRTELKRHEDALATLKEMKQDSITNLKIKALESRLLAGQQTATTEDLQKILADIAALGKS